MSRQRQQMALIGLKHPNAMRDDFLRGLEIALEEKGVSLGVPKTFSGNAFAVQRQNVNGNTTIKFKLLANGLTAFPQGEHMLIQQIKLSDGVAAAVEDTNWIPGISDVDLKNATMTMINNGTTEFKDVPLNTFVRAEEEPFSGYMELFSPVYWFAQTELEIQITLKKNVTALNTNLEISLEGCKLIS